VVAAAVEAAPGLFVNARTDTYWLAASAPGGEPPRTAPATSGAPVGDPAGVGAQVGSPAGAGDRLDETIGRLDAYRRAGAHGAFVPFVTDLTLVAAIADAVPLPLNVLWQPGTDLRALAAAGAARISTGSALYRQALSAALAAVPRLDATPGHATSASAPTAVPYAEVQDLLA
jgi:2-methylisocitrate lyase-like PEP mutase family enzyme